MTTNNQERIVYFEGKFIPQDQANINIQTHAFMYGTAVFEGIRAYWNSKLNKLFILKAHEHYIRLHNSAKICRMSLKQSPKELVELTRELLRKNNDSQDIYIRPCVYKSDRTIGPSLLNSRDDLCIFTIPMGDYIDTSKPISVCTSTWRRLDDSAIPARAKVSGSYINAALAKSEAQLNKFDDAIMLDDRGHVCEGSAMNLFMLRDNKLITSPVTNNILEGITRTTIIKLAQEELGLEVIERDIDRTELFIADELFFCGTGAQISSIGNVDHYTIGKENTIGSITQKIQDLYFKLVRGELEKYQDYLVEI